LFSHLRELFQVSVVVQTLDEEMHVVRHEAVRKNCKPLAAGRYSNLLQRIVNGFRSLEDARPLNGAERKEIAVDAAI